MKKFILTIAIGIFTIGCYAQVNPRSTHVRGYTKSNGTHVQGYIRTKPNTTINDNYSTKPNKNPFTGEQGNVEPNNNYHSGSGIACDKRTYNSYPTYTYVRKRKICVVVIILNLIALSCEVLKA